MWSWNAAFMWSNVSVMCVMHALVVSRWLQTSVLEVVCTPPWKKWFATAIVCTPRVCWLAKFACICGLVDFVWILPSSWVPWSWKNALFDTYTILHQCHVSITLFGELFRVYAAALFLLVIHISLYQKFKIHEHSEETRCPLTLPLLKGKCNDKCPFHIYTNSMDKRL